jgi:pimeloyl-ACP methyl ester carboxylesterase
MMKRALCAAIALLCGALAGCMPEFGDRAQFGITFYCPGVGNVDMGDEGIRTGLGKAGYQGQVARMTWSLSFNPAIDQTVRIIAEQGGKRLATYIQDYMDRYPGREVNLVGLSAGTGVAIWALEALKPGYKVNNVVLISSSLYHNYDVSRAMESVNGRMYNYYSSTDAVLAGPMKVFGTIDGVHFEDAAGAVGLHVPAGAADRVINVAWTPAFEKFGYYGGHMDGTNAAFVTADIAPRILTSGAPGLRQTDVATQVAVAPPAGHQD